MTNQKLQNSKADQVTVTSSRLLWTE